MRKLTTALLFLLAFAASAFAQGPIVGPGQPILCTAAAQASAAAAGTTSIISGVAGKITVLCGWHVTSSQSTATTFQIEYGTGATCTSPTVITPAFNVTSTAPSADHIDYADIQAPAGANICIVSVGATVGQQYLLYYSQF